MTDPRRQDRELAALQQKLHRGAAAGLPPDVFMRVLTRLSETRRARTWTFTATRPWLAPLLAVATVVAVVIVVAIVTDIHRTPPGPEQPQPLPTVVTDSPPSPAMPTTSPTPTPPPTSLKTPQQQADCAGSPGLTAAELRPLNPDAAITSGVVCLSFQEYYRPGQGIWLGSGIHKLPAETLHTLVDALQGKAKTATEECPLRSQQIPGFVLYDADGKAYRPALPADICQAAAAIDALPTFNPSLDLPDTTTTPHQQIMTDMQVVAWCNPGTGLGFFDHIQPSTGAVEDWPGRLPEQVGLCRYGADGTMQAAGLTDRATIQAALAQATTIPETCDVFGPAQGGWLRISYPRDLGPLGPINPIDSMFAAIELGGCHRVLDIQNLQVSSVLPASIAAQLAAAATEANTLIGSFDISDPTGNVSCASADPVAGLLICAIKKGSRDIRPDTCSNDGQPAYVELSSTGMRSICPEPSSPPHGSWVLRAGQSIQLGRIWCTANDLGMACADLAAGTGIRVAQGVAQELDAAALGRIQLPTTKYRIQQVTVTEIADDAISFDDGQRAPLAATYVTGFCQFNRQDAGSGPTPKCLLSEAARLVAATPRDATLLFDADRVVAIWGR